MPYPFPAPEPSSPNLLWLPGGFDLEQYAPGGGGGGDFFHNDVELDTAFCDLLLWDWAED